MEGVVDPVIRALYSKIGGYDQFVTEFVRVTDKLLPDKVFFRYSPELKTSGLTAEGVPVYVQILGGKAEWMAENAAAVARLGAPGLDINFGCPAKTVNRHDGGASLLQNPERLYDVITSCKKAVDGKIPVTAKVRLGFMDKSLSNEIAMAVDEAGAAKLTIHARTKKEGYKPPAHWEYIAQMKSVVKRVPIVANGDIWTVDDYFKCREVSGCEDVALGRGAIANPQLARQIRENLSPIPWKDIRSQLIPEFVQLSHEFKGDHYALTRTKQWTKLLGRQYPESKEFFEQIKRLKELPNDQFAQV